MKRNPILEDLNRINREMATLHRMKIRIGIQGDEGGEVLMIASVHEFGFTGTVDVATKHGTHKRRMNIPERSFIRASYEVHRTDIDKFVKDKVSQVIRGKLTAQQAAERIGVYCVQLVKSFIDDNQVKPEVKDATQNQKTQFTTLYETGNNIRDRITYQIGGL